MSILASASATSPPSSSSVANDVFFVEIDERSKQGTDTAPLPMNGVVLPNGPPLVAVDSDEYQAFFKSKLNLVFAAVAMTRIRVPLPNRRSCIMALADFFTSVSPSRQQLSALPVWFPVVISLLPFLMSWVASKTHVDGKRSTGH